MKKSKIEYPDQIMIITVHLIEKSCLYVIEIEPAIYKFGISIYIRDRLRKHFRDMNFKSIVKIFDCIYDSTMCRVENKLKCFARSNGELINRYDKTEIINTTDIDKYLSFVENEIAINNTRAQPNNNRKKGQYTQKTRPVERKNLIENNKKCYNCGKEFRTPTEYQRHKNRKTPCLILEVAPEHISNPNRCIFCNKIFSKHSNILRHLKTCKIKNGGMNILDEKVQYEQEIRILKDKDRQREEEIGQLKRQIAELQSKLVPPKTELLITTHQ
jgi:hypothetical protein